MGILVALVILCFPRVDVPRIAIVSAFESEQALLRDALTDARPHQIGPVTFITGRLDGHAVLLFVTGESMVNAAMHMQRALDHFTITHVIFVGVAGALDPALTVGDVVVPQAWAQYQEGVILLEVDGVPVYPDWLPPDTPICAGLAAKPVKLINAAPREDFPVDAALLDAARRIDGAQVGGTGVSGQAYVNHAAYGACLYRTFGARIVDMESAAAAQVAYVNGVPFIAVRAVSDIVGQSYAQPVENFAQVQAALENAQRVAREQVAMMTFVDENN